MLRLAIIGTNWITERFVQAALEVKEFELSAVYSRDTARAKEFAAPFNSDAVCFDDLTEMAQSDAFDAVYIASPNSLHYSQSVLMLENGKHVICEKPVASNITQAEHMYQVAEQHNVVLFEAFKTEYLPNFALISEHLPQLGKLHKVSIHYCQYSSRYQRYLDGENPNTFNPDFSNGSIMDIGFYCVSSAVALFGEPESIKASAHLLESGVDAHGSAILTYPEFEVVICHSKVSDSVLPTELQGEAGVMHIPHISECDHVDIKLRGEEVVTYQVPQLENTMTYEASIFAQQIKRGQLCQQAKARALGVSRITTEIRRQTGVVFPSDA
ncbi:Gfo/Idh/MocA family oxidoreductase [Vibrio sp. S11_S32]|uniref:Gfo/Idh/MocA family protein n=1 Tax=Vibrio sp. S11_S32 TaxID=2720225 RepID=UPI0016817E8A|nr:Gfo/Idh/MocA family oxidoreductase [Vibrio sp. S11_S32]MBD1576055.1 Gfo/Idh/MocA family oxidoreductase [Vibrio sp. S11_S32]